MECRKIFEFVESLPKTETHLHIEGALPWELLVSRFPDDFSEPPFFRSDGFRYCSFQQFESVLIEHALRVFRSARDYAEVAAMIFRDHLRQNVRYVELSFHAGMIEFTQTSGEEIIQAILSEVPPGLEVRVFMGISRNAYTPYLGPILERAVERWDGLSGIDLHGPENLPVESWVAPLWEKASRNGRTLKCHAGEFGPAQNVSWAIRDLGVRRIQHGLRAIEEEKTMDLLVDEEVTLDLCPISNYKLGVTRHWKEYPIREFMKRGVRCTLSTDDPFSFGNQLNDEYHALIRHLDFTIPELAQLARNGFEVADVHASVRDQAYGLIDRLTEEYTL